MNALALALYLAYGATAFGWRTWAQWRRTGDTGLRLRAERGSMQWWAKSGFIASLAAGVAAPIAGLGGLAPVAFLDLAWSRRTGVVLAVAGLVMTLAAQWQMGQSWRIGVDPGERTALVTVGMFRYVRNPIFTGMVLTALGLALMVGNVVAVVGFAALVVSLEVQVRLVEEPYLRTAHGEVYESYAAKAGRFMPAVGRLTSDR